jgi:NADPH:quinone reductase-like Zn-dependent oxidoreductase
MNTSAISSVTRTWRFHQTGGPDALRLEPLPTPEPGYGQVRLRVQSLSLNRADLPPLPIDREFHGLEAVPEARRYMATNQAAGKIVLTL